MECLMAKKVRMPRGTRVRSGLKEPARGKKGLNPRPAKLKSSAAAFGMLREWVMAALAA